MTEYEKELLEVKKNENALKAIELMYNCEIGDHYSLMLRSIVYESPNSAFAPNCLDLPTPQDGYTDSRISMRGKT